MTLTKRTASIQLSNLRVNLTVLTGMLVFFENSQLQLCLVQKWHTPQIHVAELSQKQTSLFVSFLEGCWETWKSWYQLLGNGWFCTRVQLQTMQVQILWISAVLVNPEWAHFSSLLWCRYSPTLLAWLPSQITPYSHCCTPLLYSCNKWR